MHLATSFIFVTRCIGVYLSAKFEIDINNDGEKDSIVDGGKILFDSACDAVGDFIDNIFYGDWL